MTYIIDGNFAVYLATQKELNMRTDVLYTTEAKLDEVDIPIDISDIISICKEYSRLGSNIQYQVESIIELGMEECLNKQIVKREALPHIKNFLVFITKNSYFGDAVDQANNCIYIIDAYMHDKPSLLN